jgi:hypothetical protein
MENSPSEGAQETEQWSQLIHKLGMHSLAKLIHYAMDNGISPARESR